MKYKIRFQKDKCVGCGACVTACVDQNDILIGDHQKPYRRIKTIEKMVNDRVVINYISSACFHCDKAVCIEACPTDCIYKDDKTGMVIYEKEKCMGCGLCKEKCPFDAIELFNGKISKCDGCYIRLQSGLEPACVRTCITGALELYGNEKL